jgi:hypothetical protein
VPYKPRGLRTDLWEPRAEMLGATRYPRLTWCVSVVASGL